METQIPELLAPAGNIDSLKAACNAGADAVYLAGKRFGARHYAANFSDEELEEAVDFAHLRGVKVYVTLNTLIKGSELNKIAEYLIFLYKIGVDAILVQDVGLAWISKKIVPDLKLHASTQMTIHNFEGIKWAAQFGFKRVVLSREMKLSEIQNVAKKVTSIDIELEIFVHGALCYSYSGQCLMSSFIGGRSGNRGTCAQPCRKEYDLLRAKKDQYGRPVKLHKVQVKDSYLLSTQDLALYAHLHKIKDLNVASLKIEGRMRSPEYVATVVSIYRDALDSIKKGKWKPDSEEIYNLKYAFNREFTGGYLLEDDYRGVMGRSLPGNRGIYLGSVFKYDRRNNEALIKLKGDIMPQKGDGIVFISTDKKEGMLLGESPQINKNILKLKRHLRQGTSVYLTKRKSSLDKAHKIIERHLNPIPVDLRVLINDDGKITLKSSFNGANSILKMEPDLKMEKALKKPLSKKTIEKQFKKTGGTLFKIRKLHIDYSGGLFAPISELNRIRRDLLNKIEDIIVSSYRPSETRLKESYKHLKNLRKPKNFENFKSDKIINLCAYVSNLEVLKETALNGCNKIYFNPFNPHQINCKSENMLAEYLKEIEEAVYILRDYNVELVLKLPKITPDHFLEGIKPLLKQAFKWGIRGIMVDGVGTAKFILDFNPQFNLYASSGLNIWNFRSIDALSEYFKAFTLSPELSVSEIQDITHDLLSTGKKSQLEVLVQGNLESLVSMDCLPCLDKSIKNDNKIYVIEDARNRIFPLRLDNECRTIILNSVELSLIDYIPLIKNTGIDNVVIDLEGRTGKYAQILCSIYMDAIKMEQVNQNKLKKMKNTLKKISLGGITTGNFLRGTTEL